MDNVSYQEKIDELIPLAEQEATERLRNEFDSPCRLRLQADGADYYPHCNWSECFHQAMNRLAREKGLRNI